jgi:hypothetical protein
MYETLILIDPRSTISADAIEQALRKVYPKDDSESPVITRSGSSFSVTWEQFAFELYVAREPHVLVESGEIAEQFAKGRAEQQHIASCASRVELSGGADPEMKYFNDYCWIVGGVEQLGIVYTFDSGSAEFMNF